MAKEPESKDTGLGQRLLEGMKRVGYANKSARFGVAVLRFAMDHRIPQTALYKWIAEDSVPTRENIIRLAEILKTTPGLLLFGPELERPDMIPPVTFTSAPHESNPRAEIAALIGALVDEALAARGQSAAQPSPQTATSKRRPK